MSVRLIAVLLLSFYLYSVVLSLKCRPCNETPCNNKTEKDCPVGTVLDICKCCKVCAKNVGEVCGGVSGISGTCGRGLVCVKPPAPPNTNKAMFKLNSKGVCAKKE